MEEIKIFNNPKHERPDNSTGQPDKNTDIKQVGNIFGGTSQAGRVYDITGIAPCLGTCGGGYRIPMIKVAFDFPEPGYKADKHVYDEGGGGEHSVSRIRDKKGRVIDEGTTAPTLDTACQVGTVTIENENVRIRRLTPKECFRLQGWTDEYFERAAFVNSDNQLYKQAGNGVTVNVIYEIGKKL